MESTSKALDWDAVAAEAAAAVQVDRRIALAWRKRPCSDLVGFQELE